ncbi:MAG: hypothetical protein DDT37_01817 [Firmicutes bacterium]|nr:hypothetical protein [candidate division NPL-UPA2 bacterium]
MVVVHDLLVDIDAVVGRIHQVVRRFFDKISARLLDQCQGHRAVVRAGGRYLYGYGQFGLGIDGGVLLVPEPGYLVAVGVLLHSPVSALAIAR